MLRAWERGVQAEAASKVHTLFPKLADVAAEKVAQMVEELEELTNDAPPESDEQAGYMGLPFVEPEDEEHEEWVDWVDDWDRYT